jgi:hypothetical protein
VTGGRASDMLERDAGGGGRSRGGQGGIYGRRAKRRGSVAHAFPNWGAAKPEGAEQSNSDNKFLNSFFLILVIKLCLLQFKIKDNIDIDIDFLH